jgi:hypothetical protein
MTISRERIPALPVQKRNNRKGERKMRKIRKWRAWNPLAGKFMQGEIYLDDYNNLYKRETEDCMTLIERAIIDRYANREDKEGTKVFSGDILVEVSEGTIVGLTMIEVDEELLTFHQMAYSEDGEVEEENWNDEDIWILDDFVIIGNIHENEEFVKDGYKFHTERILERYYNITGETRPGMEENEEIEMDEYEDEDEDEDEDEYKDENEDSDEDPPQKSRRSNSSDPD